MNNKNILITITIILVIFSFLLTSVLAVLYFNTTSFVSKPTFQTSNLNISSKTILSQSQTSSDFSISTSNQSQNSSSTNQSSIQTDPKPIASNNSPNPNVVQTTYCQSKYSKNCELIYICSL
jgi:hypothetical protein